MAKTMVQETVTVERTTCDICGKVINHDRAPYDMEWYRLKYIGWLAPEGHELWLCSIPCAVQWVKKIESKAKPHGR